MDKIALTSTVIAGLQFEKTGYVAIERTVADTGFVEIRMQRKAQK